MPQMGVSVAEGTIVEWRVGVGEPIEADQTICDISTDKIDTEVPAPVTGVVTEILVPVEATVPVGEVLARITVGGAGEAAAAASPREPAPAQVEPAAARAEPAPARAAVPSDGGGSNGASAARPATADRRYSPVVQRIAPEHGIDLSPVPGPGPGGPGPHPDVMAFVQSD